MTEPPALVVFHGEGTHPLSPLLRPGFRHCFAAVRCPSGWWSVVDGAEGLPRVYVAGGYDLAEFYRNRGHRVAEVWHRDAVRAPLVVTSCVGLVKAVVGIRSRALTPYGLYRDLERKGWCCD